MAGMGGQEDRQSLDDGQKVLHSADSREDGGEGGHDDGKPGVLDLAFKLRVNEDILQGEGRGIDVVVLRRPDAEDGADEHQDAEAESRGSGDEAGVAGGLRSHGADELNHGEADVHGDGRSKRNVLAVLRIAGDVRRDDAAEDPRADDGRGAGGEGQLALTGDIVDNRAEAGLRADGNEGRDGQNDGGGSAEPS